MKENTGHERREEVTTTQRYTVATYNNILCACEHRLEVSARQACVPTFSHWVKMTFSRLNRYPYSSSFF